MLIDLLDRPIAYHRVYVTITKSVKAAVFLSQCVYWSTRPEKENKKHNWFYKTAEDWEDETGLSRKEQAGCRKILKALNILDEKLIGIPATLHYKLNIDELEKLLSKQCTSQEARFPQTSKPVVQNVGTSCPKRRNQFSPHRETISEITAENTKEKENTPKRSIKEKVSEAENFTPSLSDSEKIIKPKEKRNPLTFLTDDFIPSESISLALDKKVPNLDKAWLEDELIKFKNYFIAKNQKYSDWSRTWYNWIVDSRNKQFIEKKKNPPTSAPPPKSDGPQNLDYVKGTNIEKYPRNEDGTFNRSKLSVECLRYLRGNRIQVIQNAQIKFSCSSEKLNEQECLLLEMDYPEYCKYYDDVQFAKDPKNKEIWEKQQLEENQGRGNQK